MTNDDHPSKTSIYSSPMPRNPRNDSRPTRTTYDELRRTKTERQRDKKTERQAHRLKVKWSLLGSPPSGPATNPITLLKVVIVCVFCKIVFCVHLCHFCVMRWGIPVCYFMCQLNIDGIVSICVVTCASFQVFPNNYWYFMVINEGWNCVHIYNIFFTLNVSKEMLKWTFIFANPPGLRVEQGLQSVLLTSWLLRMVIRWRNFLYLCFFFSKKNMTPLNSQHCKSLHFTVKLCRKNLNVRKCLIPQDVRQYSRPWWI